jgi:hypothetical protein
MRDEEEGLFENEKSVVKRSGSHDIGSRLGFETVVLSVLTSVRIDSKAKKPSSSPENIEEERQYQHPQFLREIFHKPTCDAHVRQYPSFELCNCQVSQKVCS